MQSIQIVAKNLNLDRTTYRCIVKDSVGTTLMSQAGLLSILQTQPGDYAVYSTHSPFPGYPLHPGEQFAIAMQMRNLGSTDWTNIDGYQLSPMGQSNVTWQVGAIPMDVGAVVHPGETRDFIAIITAPSASGSYLFQWKMAKGNQTFGDATPTYFISVYDPNAKLPPNPPLLADDSSCGEIGRASCRERV